MVGAVVCDQIEPEYLDFALPLPERRRARAGTAARRPA